MSGVRVFIEDAAHVDCVLITRLPSKTAAVTIDSRVDGVVAIGLGGAEVGYLPEQFEPWFEQPVALPS